MQGRGVEMEVKGWHRVYWKRDKRVYRALPSSLPQERPIENQDFASSPSRQRRCSKTLVSTSWHFGKIKCLAVDSDRVASSKNSIFQSKTYSSKLVDNHTNDTYNTEMWLYRTKTLRMLYTFQAENPGKNQRFLHNEAAQISEIFQR